MRRRIWLLVAATTSAVILAFVIPLCLLVRAAAEDRAMAAADQEAASVALLVSGVTEGQQLGQLVAAADQRGAATTSVLTPRGRTLGAPADALAQDPDVRRSAERTAAFTVRDGATGKVLVPVVTTEGTYVVRTTVPEQLMRRGVARAWLTIAALGVALILLAAAIADRLGRRVSTPVTDLAAVAHRLTDGDFDARARVEGPPETRELADALNQLADRIADLLVSERAQVGDLAHRLRTPVTALRLDAEALPDGELSARLQSHIADLQRTIDAIVRDARRPLRHTMRSRCDAREVVRERVGFWAALAEDQGRPLTVDLPPEPVPVPLDQADLVDLVDVLVDNVFAHTPDDVPFAVRLRPNGTHAVLEVADRGRGVPATRSPREGSTGLGLQIARRTVAGVGGDLTVDSSPAGTTVAVTLPLGGTGTQQRLPLH